MAILIDKRRVTEEDPIGFVGKQDKLARQIVRAWQQSKKVEHHFKTEGHFKKAIRRNLEALDVPDAIDTLFTEGNYLFSTEEKGREETLYFGNCATMQTGRLRQEHPKGPLARIDKRSRKHLFLSGERYEYLRKWHDRHCGLPHFRTSEERAKDDKYHIEFAYEGNKISGWHRSKGTVHVNKQDLDRRIASALKNIVGIRKGKGAP